jgi:thiamine biosynthesis protein ThiI
MDTKVERVLLVALFHELVLKGNNRPFFYRVALRNLQVALSDFGVRVRRIPPQFAEVRTPPELEQAVRERLCSVIGVEYVVPAWRTQHTWEDVLQGVQRVLAEMGPFASFAVRCRRTDKRFLFPAPEMESRLGAAIAEWTGARVNLTQPERTIWVRVLSEGVYIFVERFEGIGGLPVGVSGRVVALLSGGIDSPVAAWRMMLRGCQVEFVHFHSFPLVSRRSQEKARQLVQHLTRYQYHSRLFLVPLAEIQQHVLVLAPPEFRVVLYRRFMYRIAERIARQLRAHALVTGESLAQVSSQTLPNLAVIDAAAEMPVLRPLIGMSKHEIVELARRIGTYEISIQPDEDCCSLFVPRHSATRSDPEQIAALEARLPIEELVQRALQEQECVHERFPVRPNAPEPA